MPRSQNANQDPLIFWCVGLESSCGLFSPLRVPALPVKNLNGTGPVHPALAGMTGILLCAAGLPVCLTRAPKPILHPPPVSKSDVKPVPGVPGVCRKTKKKHLKKSKNPEDVVRRYMQKVKNPPDEDCTICMERLVTASGYEGVLRHKGVRPELVGRLGRCGHMYHLLCLVAMYSNGNKVGRAGQWVEPVGGAQAEGRGRDTWGPHRQPPAAPGWQPAVPHLQGHLWREDGHSAAREDGVPPHPPLAAGLR